MPDAAADGAEPAGNGRSNSIESGAIRYELSLRNRSSSFNERQPACNAGTLRFRLRSAALRIHGRCAWLRAAQDIHRRVSARRRLLCCSGAAVIWCAAGPHGTRLRIYLKIRTQSCCLVVRSYPRVARDRHATTAVEVALRAAPVATAKAGRMRGLMSLP